MRGRPTKPVAFLASPYTKGDPAVNVHFQCSVFNTMLTDGIVVPIVPLWTHFQHIVFPRPYEDWVTYDQEILKLCDCCLRLDAVYESMAYKQSESSGADAEVVAFRTLGKPVFYSLGDLYAWAQEWINRAKQEA